MTLPASCRWCDRDLDPRGVKNHERHCNENPNKGVSYTKQVELGLIDETEAGSGSPEPYQDSEPDGSLPPKDTLVSNKEPTATDGGTVECPNCGSEEVTPADEAKEIYTEWEGRPNPRALMAFSLADHACDDPDCSTLWGGKMDQPLTMQEVIDA